MSKKKKISLVIGLILFVVLAAGSIGGSSSSSSSSPSSSTSSSSSEKKDTKAKEKEKPKEEIGKLGTPYVTNHFEVTAKEIAVKKSVQAGYDSLDPEEGAKYVVINVTAKNISNESKTLITSGKLLLGEGADQIELLHDESILADGYGTFLDSVNPKLSKSTKIVYKIPAEYADKTMVWDAFGSGKYIKLQ